MTLREKIDLARAALRRADECLADAEKEFDRAVALEAVVLVDRTLRRMCGEEDKHE